MNARLSAWLLAFVVAFSAPAPDLRAESRPTGTKSKYDQDVRPHPAESIGQLEASVIETFRAKFFPKKGGAMKVVIRVDDNELLANPDAQPLRNLIKPNDVSADLSRMLRKAGFQVVKEADEAEGYLIAEVRMGARSTRIQDFGEATTEWIPDLQAEVSTSWDLRTVGQAQSLEFLGNNARAFRAFERIGTHDLIRAMGILLLRDLATDNWADVSWDPRDSLTQRGTAVPGPGKVVPLPVSRPGGQSVKPPQNAQNPPPPQPVPGQASATVQPDPGATTPPDVGGPALLAQEDRDRALRQILSALNAGKG